MPRDTRSWESKATSLAVVPSTARDRSREGRAHSCPTLCLHCGAGVRQVVSLCVPRTGTPTAPWAPVPVSTCTYLPVKGTPTNTPVGTALALSQWRCHYSSRITQGSRTSRRPKTVSGLCFQPEASGFTGDRTLERPDGPRSCTSAWRHCLAGGSYERPLLFPRHKVPLRRLAWHGARLLPGDVGLNQTWEALCAKLVSAEESGQRCCLQALGGEPSRRHPSASRSSAGIPRGLTKWV